MKLCNIKKMAQEELSIALNNSNNTVKKEVPLAPVVPWEDVIPGEQNFTNNDDTSPCCKVSEPISNIGSDRTGENDRTKKIISILKIMKSKEPEFAVYEGKNITLGKVTRGDMSEYATYLKDCKSGNIKKVKFGKSKK